MPLDDLINETKQWIGAYNRFRENPGDSVLRQELGAKLYQNPAIFNGLENDLIDDQIQTQKRTAGIQLGDYIIANMNEFYQRMDENLMLESALNLNEDYMGLIAIKNHPEAKRSAMLNLYQNKLTLYSATNERFLERLYESTLRTTRAAFKYSMSTQTQNNVSLDRQKLANYISHGLNALNADEQKEFVIGAALKIR